MASYLFILTFVVATLAILFNQLPFFKLNCHNPIDSKYIELAEIKPLDGNLSPNDLLKKATYIGYGKLIGAESIVFDSEGNFYTGLLNGQIVKVDKNGNIQKVVQIGEETNEAICNDPHGNPKCGRPLGLRLLNTTLYVADSYYGILKVDINTGSKQLILSANDARFGDKKLKFVNDLDIDGDIIYFLDTSTERTVQEALEEHVEARERGRFYQYNTKTDQITLLLENLYFPNGIQLTPEKDAILINENTAARILKYFLKGEKKGTVEVFADLPGFSDNIRLTPHNTLLVPFAIVRHNTFGSLLDLFGTLPSIRNALSYFIDFGGVFKIVPKYGLLVEYDLNGNVLKSWHDASGKVVESASHIEFHNGKLYLGSFYINYVAVLDY